MYDFGIGFGADRPVFLKIVNELLEVVKARALRPRAISHELSMTPA